MTAQVLIQQVLLKRGNSAVASAYVGPIGEVVVDTDLHTLRVQNASEPGGYLVATEAFVDAQVNVITAGIPNLVGNLIANTIPASDRLVNGVHELVLNVGSSGAPYVNFPALNGKTTLIQGSEIVAIGGDIMVASVESAVRLSANVAGDRKNWLFSTDGALTFPGDATITNPADTLVTTGLRIHITGAVYDPGTGGIDLELEEAIGERISTNPSFYSFRFLSGAGLGVTLPGLFISVPSITGSTWRSQGWGLDTPDISSTFEIFSADYADPYSAPGYLQLSSDTSVDWTFGTDGVLTLPAGSSRVTSYGQITMETDNGGSGIYLNATGVNLVYANTNVTLRSNSTGTTNDWTFGTDGNLTLPTDGTISYTPANPSDWNSPPPTTIQAALDRLAAFSPGA